MEDVVDLLDKLEKLSHFKFEMARGNIVGKENQIILYHEIVQNIQNNNISIVDFQESLFCSMASYNHTQIIAKLNLLLAQELDASQYAHYVESLKIKNLFWGSIRIPDLVISLVQTEIISPKSEIENPHTIIEVLSPSTEKTDRHEKLEEYQDIVSLQEYLLIVQDRYLIEQYLRKGKTEWTVKIYDDAQQTCLMTAGVKIQLNELYKKVKF